jgi:hypothetical protein
MAINNNFIYNIRLQPHPKTSHIKYVFTYTSLITPYKITNIRLINNSRPFISDKQKLFVKQSYLLMTWLWYIQSKFTTRSKRPSFAFKPTKTHKTTLIKAPMAHKTFSQEQFQFKFFNIIISFYIKIPQSLVLRNSNNLIFLLYKLRNMIPFVETNFFLLKTFRIIFPFNNTRFLKL